MTYLRVFICVLGFSSCLGDNDDIRYGNRRDYENEERLKAYAIVGK